MGKTDISFGKITGTPTKTSWSQAYNAGSLFVVLSLSLHNPEEEHEALTIIGKHILNDLEAEFFTLEEKTLEKITEVLQGVIHDVPKTVSITSLLAFIKDNVLYLLLIGDGSILIKRQGRIGTLLQGADALSREILTASGFLSSKDTVFLSSASFRKLVPTETITDALSLEDTDAIVEALTPHVHKTTEGSASAIVFRVEGNHKVLDEQEEQDELLTNDTSKKEEVPSPPSFSPPEQETPFEPENSMKTSSFLSQIKNSERLAFFSQLSHRKRVFLTIASLILIVLVVSIIFTINHQNAQERASLFNDLYPQALKNYEEGEGLLTLNKALAREELEEAQSILAKADGKFPKGSDEYEKTEELKANIENLLGQVGESRSIQAEEISNDENILLSTLIPKDRIAVVEDETSVYYVTDEKIASIRKGSKSEQTLVENDNDWGKAVGLGKFGSNFYVLDTAKGILKLVPSGNDYTVSEYLKDDISMTNATSLTIDSSIYVLFNKGEVKKFTRGAEEKFTVKGLENPFRKPVQIFTSEDIENLYILDPLTARIVKLTKSGAFTEEYLSSVLQNAKGFSISSDEKKASILSGGKLYEISL